MSSAEELREYNRQIEAIDAQLSSVDDQQRKELLETRADLQELIDLLMEEDSGADGTPSTSGAGDTSNVDTDSQDSVSFDPQDVDDLVGLRVAAPFPRSKLALSLHSAIVLEVLPAANPEQGLLARVLYSAPMIPAMRPCSHFLSGTCRFEDKCKFSHGEIVPMRDLEEYIEPDFSSLRVDGLVLASVDGVLWEVGRLTSRGDNESAVRLLSSGKEVAAPNESVVPVDYQEEPDDIALEDVVGMRPKNESWPELKTDVLGSSKVGDIGQWNGGGFGLKMMQKMGYLLGEGLGKNSDGIVHAVQATVYPKNRGLDENAKKRVATGQEKMKKRVKRGMQQAAPGLCSDIFGFLNRKLEGTIAKVNDHAMVREEAKKLQKCSEKSLGIKGVDIESELKQMRSKVRKLEEGIVRNKSDSRTVDRLQATLAALKRDISRLEGSHTRLHQEIHDRKQKKKEIF